MRNLKKLSKKISNILITVLHILPIVGFTDATYLTVEHYTGGNIACVIFQGCDVVNTSKYATVIGTPIALFGMAYYFTLILLASIYSSTGRKEFLLTIFMLSGIGFIFSAYLTYLQLFIINAICFYCVVSAGITTIIFGLSGYLLKNSRDRPSETEPLV